MNVRPRETVYKGVRMRSRLEAHHAHWLDSVSLAWEYEPNCFASERGQYLPDFRVGNGRLYHEVKPFTPELVVGDVQRRMEIIWASEPSAVLRIIVYRDALGNVAAPHWESVWSALGSGSDWEVRRCASRTPLVRQAWVPPVEMEMLRIAVHRPGDVADRLCQDLFVSGVARRAYNALANAMTFDEAVEGADDLTAALLRRVAVEEPSAPAEVVLVSLMNEARAPVAVTPSC